MINRRSIYATEIKNFKISTIMKRIYLFFVFLLFLGLEAQGQTVNYYAFTSANVPYMPMGVGIVVAINSTVANWDDNPVIIPLDFNFVYDGRCYNQIKLNPNGYFYFGNDYYYNQPIYRFNNVISAFGIDLAGETNVGVGATIKYEKNTNYLLVEWLNVRRFANRYDPTENINFQIKIYKEGVIEFNYGNISTIFGSESPQVGLRGNSSAYTQTLSVPSTGNWNSPLLNNSINNTCHYGVIKPANGLRYTMTPPTKAVVLETNGTVVNNIDMGEVFTTASSSRNITVRNVGTEPVNITNLNFTTAAFSATVNTTLGICNSFTTAIVFNPDAVGVHNSPISVLSPDAPIIVNNPTASISGTGKLVPFPKIKINTIDLNAVIFPDVETNSFATAFITIQNVGELPLTVHNINISSITGATTFFSITPSIPFATAIDIAPVPNANNFRFITVVFDAGAVTGNYLSKLTINSNGGANGSVVDNDIFLFGHAQQRVRTLAYSPTMLNFGSVNINTNPESVQNVGIINSGDARFYLVAPFVSIGGANSADFIFDTVDDEKVNPDNDKVPVKLSIKFKPSTLGSKTATLSIITKETLTNPTLTLTLQGHATAGTLAMSTAIVSFLSVQAFETATLPLNVFNTGTGQLKLISVSLNSVFFEKPLINTNDIIPPNSAINGSITFKPPFTSIFTHELHIETDAAVGNPFATVFITGTAIQAKMQTNMTKVDCGEVLVGNHFITTLTITNIGNANLIVYPPEALPQYFSFSPAFLTTTIAPNTSFSTALKFEPLAGTAFMSETFKLKTKNKNSWFGTYSEETIDLYGKGVSRVMELTWKNNPSFTTIDFSFVDQGKFITTNVSTIGAFVVKNNGNSNFLIDNVSLAKGGASEYVIKPYIPLVEAGQSVDIPVVFGATAGNINTDKTEILFISISPTTPLSSFNKNTIFLTAQVSVRTLEWITALAFGTVELGQSVPRPTQIRNVGNRPVTLRGFDGLDGYNMRVDYVGGTKVLEPFDIMQVGVTFRPTEPRSYNQTIRVIADEFVDNGFTSVTGTGLPTYIIQFFPSTLDFGKKVRAKGEPMIQNLEVRNIGNSSFTVKDVIIKNLSENFEVDFTDNNGIVNPNSKITLKVKFKPSEVGIKNTELQVSKTEPALTGGNSTLKVLAEADSAARRVVSLRVNGKENTPLDLGNVHLNESGSADFVIVNTGNEDLVIEGIDLQNAAKNAWRVEPNTNIPLKPYTPQKITVTFAPKKVESISMPITIRASTATDQPTKQITVTGKGVQGEISINATKLDFGLVRKGEEKTLDFSFTNKGDYELRNVKIKPSNSAYTASLVNANIKLNETATVTVTFKPTIEGATPNLGEITITADNVTTRTLELVGEGTVAEIFTKEKEINFGNVRHSTPSESKLHTFVISNKKKAPLAIKNITSSDTTFKVNWEKKSIDQVDSLRVFVRFSPTQPTNYNGSLFIEVDKPESTNGLTNEKQLIIPLKGEGTQAVMAVYKSEIDFELWNNHDQKPKSLFITVNNEGKAPLNLKSIGVPYPFSINPTYPKTINPMEKGQVEVFFQPKESVLRNDKLFSEKITIEVLNAESTRGLETNNLKTLKVSGTAIVPLQGNFKIKEDPLSSYKENISPTIEFFTGAIPATVGYRSTIISPDSSLVRMQKSNPKFIEDYDVEEHSPVAKSYFYTANIPFPAENDLGTVYSFVITDRLGNKHYPPVNLYYSYVENYSHKLQIDQYGDRPSDYQIISVPYWLANPNIIEQLKNQLGNYNIKKWRMFRYSPDSGYVELGKGLTNFKTGEAYMLIVKNAPEGKVLNITGITAENKKKRIDESNPFELKLLAGWNLIAPPYGYTLNLADIRLKEYESVIPLDKNPFLTKFDGKWIQKNEIKSFEGGFIYTAKSITIKFLVLQGKKKTEGSSGGRIEKTTVPFTEQHFEAVFQVKDGKYEFDLGAFGMHPEAQVGEDRYDLPAIPVLSENEVHLFFPKQNQAPKLTQSFVKPAENHVWEMQVRGTEKILELTWDKNYFKTSKQVILYDVVRQVPVDMKTLSTYKFRNEGNNAFRVFYGTYDFINQHLVPEKSLIGEVFPNPYQTEINIPFSLPPSPSAYKVQIEIYDLQGRAIYKDQKAYSSGYHTWQYVPEQKNTNYKIRIAIQNGEMKQEKAFKLLRER